MRDKKMFKDELSKMGYNRCSDINTDVSLYITVKNGQKIAVIMVDNYENMVSSKYGAKRLIEMAKGKLELSSGDFKYIVVYLDICNNPKLIFNKNTIFINRDGYVATALFIEKDMRECAEDLKKISCRVGNETYFYNTRQGYTPFGRVHPVFLTYILVASIIGIYVMTFRNSDIYGLSFDAYENGEKYRILTYMFMHASIFHLIGNMFSLFMIGTAIESQLGALQTMFIFIFSGLTGGYVSMTAYADDTMTVGASGAICGMIAANIIIIMFLPKRRHGNAVIFSAVWLIYILIAGITSDVDNYCHVGGIIGGIISALMLYLPKGLIHESKILEAKKEHYNRVLSGKYRDYSRG